jgi:CRISPR-associated protein Cst2
MKDARALTMTFLTPVSFASLNGSDKEADNISNIKKITRETDQYPYVSAQAIRRALRDQLAVLGRKLSEGVTATIKKGAATTQQDPEQFIDDDLFGFMGTEEAKEGKKGKSTKRTSPVRVSPLVSLHKYEGDLDFATNFMGVEAGGDPNIFETEIHSGLYRGTILIELDRVSYEKGDEGFNLPNNEKSARVNDFLTAFKNLWTSGRQTRFLADISPKFIAAAMLRTKNPIFLESIIPKNGGINTDLVSETVKDFETEIVSDSGNKKALIFGARKGLFSGVPEGTVSIGEAFNEMMKWIDEYYK